MHFSQIVVAALSGPLWVDATSKDEAMEDTNAGSFGEMHFGDKDYLSARLMLAKALIAMSSSFDDEGGLDAWNGEASLAQVTELRNPEYESEYASRDEKDDFAVDIGRLAEDCASYPVVNETGQLTSLDLNTLLFFCYSDSQYLDHCPEDYNVGLHCWNTSLLTDLSLAFYYLRYFNDDISSWDTGNVTSLDHTFFKNYYVNSDISNWDTGRVTSMNNTFFFAFSFNSDISTWDTGKVMNMAFTFAGARSFNSDISAWDTGKVTTLEAAFLGASSFNSDISVWNTGNVMTLEAAFLGASSFDSNISSWETGNVTNLFGAFQRASSFNSDISSWDVGKVTSMYGTFERASSFNSDISSWDVGKVTSLYGTFGHADSFNSDISSWDVGNVMDMSFTFFGASSFNQCLGRWAANSPDDVVTKNMFNGSGCPNQSDPDPEKGPWCQGFEERCFGACSDAKDFRFSKKEKSCDSIINMKKPSWEKLRRVCKKKAFPGEEATGKKIRVWDVCQEACGRRGFGPGRSELCYNFFV